MVGIFSRGVFREGVKYYFADFVRKGGTPHPFTDKIFAKKKLRIWEDTPRGTKTVNFPDSSFLRAIFFRTKRADLGFCDTSKKSGILSRDI